MLFFLILRKERDTTVAKIWRRWKGWAVVGVSFPIFISIYFFKTPLNNRCINPLLPFIAGDFDGCGRFPGFFAGPSPAFNMGDGFGGYTYHFN